MKKSSKSIACLLTIIVLGVFIVLLFLSRRNHLNGNINHSTSRNLLFEFVLNDSKNSIKYNPEDFANNYCGTIQYSGFEKVSIYIGTELLDLREAIKSGKVTVEEIISHARSDAINGFCLEKKASKNGLTTFSYLYYDYDLTYIDDIYETPDGEQHHIRHLGIYPSGESRNISQSYYADNTPYPYKLDREDWGITLEVIKVSAESVTVNISQSSGQQIGSLEVASFSIYSPEKPLFTINFNSDETKKIQKNGLSKIVFTWGASQESLNPGNYLLVLNIQDIYNPDDVHPLMQNFYDTQRYYVEFTIQ